MNQYRVYVQFDGEGYSGRWITTSATSPEEAKTQAVAEYCKHVEAVEVVSV